MRRLLAVAVVVLAAGAGVGLGFRLAWQRPRPLPDPPAVLTQIREVARLETLQVALYKKVTHAPHPAPAESLWGDVANWALHAIRAPEGRAIVFADARLGLDLDLLTEERLRVIGRTAFVALPPMRTVIELKPGETEIIGSNLDSRDTAQLLELAKDAFAREVAADRQLQERARRSAERSVRALLLTLGFEQVTFVEQLPPAPGTG